MWEAIVKGRVAPAELQLGLHCPLCQTQHRDPIEQLNEKANEGCVWATYDLSCTYRSGLHGAIKNDARAVGLLLEAAKQGYLEAQFTLGNCYLNGECGVRRSAEKAKHWYDLAACQGHTIAEHNLALIHQRKGNYAEFIRL